jgi:hypothetical protein
MAGGRCSGHGMLKQAELTIELVLLSTGSAMTKGSPLQRVACTAAGTCHDAGTAGSHGCLSEMLLLGHAAHLLSGVKWLFLYCLIATRCPLALCCASCSMEVLP